MSIYYCKKTRRQFLLGAGKSALVLPLLPSLLPKDVFAQSVAPNKKMMMFWFDHGGMTTVWPRRTIATQAVGSNGARQVALSGISRSAISPIFSNNRYETIKNNNLMTILRGLDTAVEYGSAHGNFTLACGEGKNSEGNYPSLDTIIERSNTVYPTSTASHVRKAIRINLMGDSVFYDKIGNRIQVLPHYTSNIRTFYNEIFSGLTGGTVPPVDNTNAMKSNILNRVHESFTSFRSNRRISSDDKARLDQHMGYISDLQRSFSASVPMQTASCNRPVDPGDISNNPVAYNKMYMELLAIAFKCGVTKFGAMLFDSHSPRWIPGLPVPNGTEFHDVFHGSAGNAAQEAAYVYWWKYFADLIADSFLANLQDIEGDTGRSYMENMITGMVAAGGLHELGWDGGHAGLDSQQILFGNMGGAMRSGNYVSLPTSGGKNLPYNNFLITLLSLMGVPRSEYAYATSNGQGFGYYGGFGSNHPFRSRFYDPITEIMR